MKWVSLTLSLTALLVACFPYIPTRAKNAEAELKKAEGIQVALWRKLDSRIVDLKGAQLEEAIKVISVEEVVPGNYDMSHELMSLYFTVPCKANGREYLGTIQAFLHEDGYWSSPGLGGKVRFGGEFTRLIFKAVGK
jgi:hypothetical protein